MHNSPAHGIFNMWSVKSYGLLQLGDAKLTSTWYF